MARYVVDRFEGEWAVLEEDQARTFSVPRSWLPSECREGDVLSVSDVAVSGGQRSVLFELDPSAQKERLAKAHQ